MMKHEDISSLKVYLRMMKSQQCQIAAALIEDMQSRLESLEKDAARLDWLGIAGSTSIELVLDREHDGLMEVSTDDVCGHGKTVRDAIDAAMQANKGE